ncbi:hypothetical protein [Microterricola pindariensis]|uniref:Uncharacterized protein n=1 Tax=Microterricola pindariensis TaxID=478010 RepID=A0ABX5ARB4_9MICO|nr:hypothetical protein [Microterricola pindariensis]PPL14513.1 hypothetical protein GY24_16095 [Microterricola pindariensis]
MTTDAAAPLFATDEEALAAAEEAYAAYLAASDAITAQGDGNLDGIKSLVTPRYFAEISPAFERLVQKGFRTSGGAEFDSLSLLRHDIRADGTVLIQVYVCQDITEVSVVSGSGELEPILDRQNRLPLVISVVADPEAPGDLLVDRSEVWGGRDFC